MALVTLEHLDGISTITLNRPDRLNAVSVALLQDLHAAWVDAHAEPGTRVIVFAGAGRAFCAGDDLKEFDVQGQSAHSMHEMGDNIQRITRDIMFGPKLVIGAMQGYAVGAGFEWLLNCDMVVAADNLVCFFPEMGLGHFVTGGVTHLLPQSLGNQRAMEWMVLGERQNAATLHALGIVNRVVPLAELGPAARALAQQVLARSAHATAHLKRVVHSQVQTQLNVALEAERQAAFTCFQHPQTAEQIRAFGKPRA